MSKYKIKPIIGNKLTTKSHDQVAAVDFLSLKIMTKDKITLRKKISEIEELLPREYFIRCHRSYIENVKHIKSIFKNHLLLADGEEIPISRGKYKDVNDIFINYICE